MGTLVANRSIIHVFSDSSCQKFLASASTDKVAVDGDCLKVPNGVNSVKTIQVAPGCQVSTYSDYCSNNATFAAVEHCMNMSIGSSSVDCSYLRSSSVFKDGNSESSTDNSPSSSFSSQPSPSTTISTSSYFSPIAITISSPHYFNPSSSFSSQSSSSAQSSTTTSVHTDSGGGHTLSTSAQIAIGVVIPIVAIMISLIFGIRHWNSKNAT